MVPLVFRENVLLVAVLICFLDLSSANNVLIVSLDGFRWDYLHRLGNLTSFHRMIADGGWAMHGMKNAFITKTLPNHYTIATGLYEESHGIVGNTMFDPVFNETYVVQNVSTFNDPKWYGGEPIWITNERGNSEHRSGSVMWPGTMAPIKSYMPYRDLPFNKNTSFEDRVDTIVDWFSQENPINFGMVYIQEPDGVGHNFGPDSWELDNMLVKLNEVLERLLNKLEDNDLLHKTDLIVTSDHGMTSLNDSCKIELNDYISLDKYFVTSSSPVAAIFPKPYSKDLEDEIFKNLSGIAHTHLYRKADIPEHYHFKHNRRIPPILLVPEEHCWVSHNGTAKIAGNHGYNNSLTNMHPIFIAMGPSFKKGAKVDMINNVDLYPLMCKLLGVTPAPNNGSLDIVEQLLVDKLTKESGTSFAQYILIVIVAGLVSGVFSVAVCQVHRSYRRRQMYHVRMLSGYSTGLGSRNYPGTRDDKAPLMSETSDEELT